MSDDYSTLACFILWRPKNLYPSLGSRPIALHSCLCLPLQRCWFVINWEQLLSTVIAFTSVYCEQSIIGRKFYVMACNMWLVRLQFSACNHLCVQIIEFTYAKNFQKQEADIGLLSRARWYFSSKMLFGGKKCRCSTTKTQCQFMSVVPNCLCLILFLLLKSPKFKKEKKFQFDPTQFFSALPVNKILHSSHSSTPKSFLGT